MSAEVESVKLYEGDEITVYADEKRILVTISYASEKIKIHARPLNMGMKYRLELPQFTTLSSGGALVAHVEAVR